MTQTDLQFCQAPAPDTVAYRLLVALQAGARLTPLSALQEFNCLSLSQRIGELKKQGWPIVSEMIEVASGKRVACYRMGK